MFVLKSRTTTLLLAVMAAALCLGARAASEFVFDADVVQGLISSSSSESQATREMLDSNACNMDLMAGDGSCPALFNGQGTLSSITVDGRCNYNNEIGFYIAICDGSSSVKFLRSHCDSSDCSRCNEYVPECDVGAGECGFLANNEKRSLSPATCSERRNPLTGSADASYGVLGQCDKPTCASSPVRTPPPEPCSWNMRTSADGVCKTFLSTGDLQEVVANGRCNYNREIGHYIAICSPNGKLQFKRAHCSRKDCTQCNEYKTARKCDFAAGECGFVSRDFAYASGDCFQILDSDGDRYYGYDFVGTCANPTCATSSSSISKPPGLTLGLTLGGSPP